MQRSDTRLARRMQTERTERLSTTASASVSSSSSWRRRRGRHKNDEIKICGGLHVNLMCNLRHLQWKSQINCSRISRRRRTREIRKNANVTFISLLYHFSIFSARPTQIEHKSRTGAWNAHAMQMKCWEKFLLGNRSVPVLTKFKRLTIAKSNWLIEHWNEKKYACSWK